MKMLLFFILLVCFKISTTQAQKISNPDIIKYKPVKPTGTTQKPIALQQQGERNILVPKLPDLKFTAFNVTATPSTTGGITACTLNKMMLYSFRSKKTTDCALCEMNDTIFRESVEKFSKILT